MAWQVLLLREFEEDIEDLASTHGVDPVTLVRAVRDVFEDPFKAERIEQLLTSGSSTSAVARLKGSQHPPSIRLRILGTYRVTVWCFPRQRHAIVTHAFHKS